MGGSGSRRGSGGGSALLSERRTIDELSIAELSIRARGARGNSRRRTDLRRGPPHRAAGVVVGSGGVWGLGQGAARLCGRREARNRGQEQGERSAAEAREAPRSGALPRQYVLRGSQLHRSHGRNGARAGQGAGTDDEGSGRKALAFRQDFPELGGRPRRGGQTACVLAKSGLGRRARGGDREDGEKRAGGEGAGVRRRPYRRERSLGARWDETRQEPGELALPLRLGQPEVLRRLLPARALDRSRRRHPRSPSARNQAVGERRADAGLPYEQADLRHRRADRDALFARDAPPRRSRAHGDSCRRGHGTRPFPQTRRRRDAVDRIGRRAEPYARLIVARKSTERIEYGQTIVGQGNRPG